MLGRAKKTNDTIPAYMNQLSKRTLCVDTSMLVYKVHSIAVSSVANIHVFSLNPNGRWDKPDEEDIISQFEASMREYISGMLKTGISFIFVIEGKTPDMKTDTHDKRQKQRLERSLLEYPDLERHIKSLRDKYLITRRHIDITISILKEMRCTVLQAEYESEGVCAHLVSQGKAHGVLAEDGDLVMLGCPVMIRKLRSLSLSTGHFEYQGLALVDVLINIGFLSLEHTKDQYIEASHRLQLLCILSGTDYHKGVFRMGIIRIHKMMLDNNCHTYEDVCNVDPRFLDVPYNDILKTLDNNTKYTVL